MNQIFIYRSYPMTTTSSPPRNFQAYNSYQVPLPSAIKKTTPITSIDDSVVFGRVPYSSIRISTRAVPSPSDGILKRTSISQKRRSSTISLSNLLPRRKSLQTTALATRRQSLWMNIAKNPSTTDSVQPTVIPLGLDHSSLTRKKILRLLLVFSYLLSISLFAIGLATFYGFFWSGYSTSETTNVFNVKTSVQSLISLTTNSTIVQSQLEIENVIQTSLGKLFIFRRFYF